MDPTPSRDDDDGALVRAIARGDEHALARVYDVHGPRVYGLALRVAGQAAEAEEVMQDVFMTLWRTADRFDPAKGSLGGYLVTLARNRAIDRVRARKGRRLIADGLAPESFAGPAGTPADRASIVEQGLRARSALLALPPPERQVLELAYFDGLSQTEIADRLGDALGTVKGRTRTGLRRLREALASAFGGAS